MPARGSSRSGRTHWGRCGRCSWWAGRRSRGCRPCRPSGSNDRGSGLRRCSSRKFSASQGNPHGTCAESAEEPLCSRRCPATTATGSPGQTCPCSTACREAPAGSALRRRACWCRARRTSRRRRSTGPFSRPRRCARTIPDSADGTFHRPPADSGCSGMRGIFQSGAAAGRRCGRSCAQSPAWARATPDPDGNCPPRSCVAWLRRCGRPAGVQVPHAPCGNPPDGPRGAAQSRRYGCILQDPRRSSPPAGMCPAAPPSGIARSIRPAKAGRHPPARHRRCCGPWRCGCFPAWGPDSCRAAPGRWRSRPHPGRSALHTPQTAGRRPRPAQRIPSGYCPPCNDGAFRPTLPGGCRRPSHSQTAWPRRPGSGPSRPSARRIPRGLRPSRAPTCTPRCGPTQSHPGWVQNGPSRPPPGSAAPW